MEEKEKKKPKKRELLAGVRLQLIAKFVKQDRDQALADSQDYSPPRRVDFYELNCFSQRTLQCLDDSNESQFKCSSAQQGEFRRVE